jgi:hypothetical protein
LIEDEDPRAETMMAAIDQKLNLFDKPVVNQNGRNTKKAGIDWI